jgi:hypothetical protein
LVALDSEGRSTNTVSTPVDTSPFATKRLMRLCVPPLAVV